MEYEFTELEHLVSSIINPTNISFEKLTETHYQQCAISSLNEVELIFKKIKLAVLQAPDENCIRVYIHQHQACLIGLADEIYIYLKSGKLKSQERDTQIHYITNCCDVMYQCINKLLLFLEKQYRQYFDLDARLTLLCHEEFTKAINDNLIQIKEELKRSAISEDLINITSDPFDSLQNVSITITYRERNYLQVLLSEILSQVNQKQTTVTTDELCDLLLGINYNNTRFLTFIIRYYVSATRDFGNSNELMVFYFFKKKMLNQLAIKPMLAYDIGLPNIREQIGNWFSEEIQFLEKKQQFSELDESLNNEYRKEKIKIHTSLGVGQLACAVKLLVDCGIIVNSNYTEITKLVAKNFRNDKVENISEGSLRNKYYNIEKVTADKMKDVVSHLLNMVRSY